MIKKSLSFMKAFLLFIVFGLFFVTACTQQQLVCPDGSVVSNPSGCKEMQEKLSGTPEAEPHSEIVRNSGESSSSDIPLEIQELLDNSKKVTSISYDFKQIHKPLELARRTWIKDTVIKQELPIKTGTLNSNEADTVILNNAERTATLFCESRKYCIKTGNIGEVEYNEYYFKTPFDWLSEIDSAEKVSEETMFRRKTWKLLVNEEIAMWIDTYYGMPLRVEIDNQRYEFQNPLFNSVTDAEISFRERE